MKNFLCVRAACGLRIHSSTDDALPLYVHERITHCLRESFKKYPIITCSACRAHNKCVTRAWSVLTRHFLSSTVQIAHTTYADLTEQVRAPHLQRMVCAVTSGRNKLTHTALARTYNGRASKNSVREKRE